MRFETCYTETRVLQCQGLSPGRWDGCRELDFEYLRHNPISLLSGGATRVWSNMWIRPSLVLPAEM